MFDSSKRKHTPGPWRWMEDDLNRRIAKRLCKKPEKLAKRDGALVYALKGPPIGNPRTPDEWRFLDDYKDVMTLYWEDVRGNEVFGAMPTEADAQLIAAAPELLEALEKSRDAFAGAGMIAEAEMAAAVIERAVGSQNGLVANV